MNKTKGMAIILLITGILFFVLAGIMFFVPRNIMMAAIWLSVGTISTILSLMKFRSANDNN